MAVYHRFDSIKHVLQSFTLSQISLHIELISDLEDKQAKNNIRNQSIAFHSDPEKLFESLESKPEIEPNKQQEDW